MVKTQSKGIPIKDGQVIQSADVDYCARMCVEQLGDGCRGFDYCGNQIYCVLSSEYLREQHSGQRGLTFGSSLAL